MSVRATSMRVSSVPRLTVPRRVLGLWRRARSTSLRAILQTVVGSVPLSFVLAFAVGISGVLAQHGGIAFGASTTLSIISGEVLVAYSGFQFVPAEDGLVLGPGYVIRTGAESRAFITFFEGSTVTIEPNSELSIQEALAEPDGDRVILLSQNIGRTWHVVASHLSPGSRYEVRTPASTAIVRGTAFELVVQLDQRGEPQTTTVVTEGAVGAKKQATVQTPAPQEVVVPAGFQQTTTRAAPVEPPKRQAEPKNKVTVETSAAGGTLVQDSAGRLNGITKDGKVILQTTGAQLKKTADGKVQVILPNVPDGKITTVVDKEKEKSEAPPPGAPGGGAAAGAPSAPGVPAAPAAPAAPQAVDVVTTVEQKNAPTVRVEERVSVQKDDDKKVVGVELGKGPAAGPTVRVIENARANVPTETVEKVVERIVERAKKEEAKRDGDDDDKSKSREEGSHFVPVIKNIPLPTFVTEKLKEIREEQKREEKRQEERREEQRQQDQQRQGGEPRRQEERRSEERREEKKDQGPPPPPHGFVPSVVLPSLPTFAPKKEEKREERREERREEQRTQEPRRTEEPRETQRPRPTAQQRSDQQGRNTPPRRDDDSDDDDADRGTGRRATATPGFVPTFELPRVPGGGRP